MKYKVNWKYKPLLFLIDLLGNIIFFWTKLKRFDEEKIKKILVIRLDHIGDVLMTTAALRALKKRFKKAEIHVLTRSFTKELLNHNKSVNKVITFNAPWFKRKESLGWPETIKFIRELRKQKYDLVVELHSDPRNIILAFFAGEYSIGYGIRGLGFLLNQVVAYNTNLHIIDQNLEIVKSLGCDVKNRNLEIFINKKDEAYIKKSLNSIKNIKKLLKIIIHSGTGRINKYWLNENWAELTVQIAKHHPCLFIFAGNSSDEKDVEEIIDMIRNYEKNQKNARINILNLCGKTTLSQLSALVKNADLVLSPDTGISHIAKALGVRSVTLFGPTNPRIWGYNDKLHRALYKKIECSFCDLPDCKLKREKYKCMREIQVSDIFQEAESLLSYKR